MITLAVSHFVMCKTFRTAPQLQSMSLITRGDKSELCVMAAWYEQRESGYCHLSKESSTIPCARKSAERCQLSHPHDRYDCGISSSRLSARSEPIFLLDKRTQRGQEGGNVRGGTREKVHKKSPEEVQHPVLNRVCFLTKPALHCQTEAISLWSPQPPTDSILAWQKGHGIETGDKLEHDLEKKVAQRKH